MMSEAVENIQGEKGCRLPANWMQVRLPEIATINPTLDKSEIDDELLVSFVPMPAVEAETGRIDVSTHRKFVEVKKGYTGFLEDDVLFAKITPCMENGKMAVVPPLKNDLGFGSTEFHVLRPAGDISPSYLYYFVSSKAFRIGAERNMTGAVGQRRVPTTVLSDSEIPLPPAAEQQRIVAKLEELFSELDKGVENLRTAQQQLKVYRQALLDKAMSSLESVDCDLLPLQRLIGNLSQGWSPKCDLNREAMDDEWAIIKTTVVQPMRHVPQECKPLPPNLEPRPDLEIKDGDFLMTRKGPRNRTGVVCLVRKARPKSMLCDTVYRFRCNAELVDPEYLELLLNSPSVVAELDRRKSGISDSGISLNHSKIKTISLQIPRNLDSQRKIVDLLGEKLSVIDQLETTITTSLQQAEALRQSILKKAFSGQLVPQDPDDEPASVLLERIRAERAAQETTAKHGRKAAKPA